jgi:cytochrome c-type biogenesis protein CcmH/NrfG
MSATLPFARYLLSKCRNLERLGQNHTATRLLNRLTSFRDTPEDVARETHVQLAELHVKCGRLKNARRELAAALALEPDNARVHFLMAEAVEQDGNCDPIRALWHYRQCTRLDAENPRYWCAFGLLAVRLGETTKGLKALRRAYALAPEDHEVLRDVVEGLREADEAAEAGKLLRIALFRNPRDQHVRALWQAHQFHTLHAEQQAARVAQSRGNVILSFPPQGRQEVPQAAGNKRIRHDLPSGTPRPKLTLRRKTIKDRPRRATGDGR